VVDDFGQEQRLRAAKDDLLVMHAVALLLCTCRKVDMAFEPFRNVSSVLVYEQARFPPIFRSIYTRNMKTVPVAEVRSNLSSLLKEVESGNEIGISFGRTRHTIAVIVPIAEYKRIKERKLGSLAGKVHTI
jgi:prevent-host-death family protein